MSHHEGESIGHVDVSSALGSNEVTEAEAVTLGTSGEVFSTDTTEVPVSPLSPRQMDRMRAFQHVIDTVEELESTHRSDNNILIPSLNENGEHNKNDEGNLLYFLTPRDPAIHGLNSLAFAMYRGFQADPNMEQTASEYVKSKKEAKKAKEEEDRDEELSALHRMIEAGSDEII